jgi:hypothetical protein
MDPRRSAATGREGHPDCISHDCSRRSDFVFTRFAVVVLDFGRELENAST